MQVVSLGDLVLDVVVRVRSDVARGADTPAQVALYDALFERDIAKPLGLASWK